MKFLIYALVDPRSKQWHYIGRSTRGLLRPMEHSSPWALAKSKNLGKSTWIRSLQALGLMYETEVLEEFSSPKDLEGAERDWISAALLAGVSLYNANGGGGGRPTDDSKTLRMEIRLSESDARALDQLALRRSTDRTGVIRQLLYEASS